MYFIFNICMVHDHDAQLFAIYYKCLFICRYQVPHGFGDDETVLKYFSTHGDDASLHPMQSFMSSQEPASLNDQFTH